MNERSLFSAVWPTCVGLLIVLGILTLALVFPSGCVVKGHRWPQRSARDSVLVIDGLALPDSSWYSDSTEHATP